jgi:hydroxyacylglutathione hydrolase
MPTEIGTISLSLPFGLGKVNCYLVKTDTGYILIDTGSSNKRTALSRELEKAGCHPGNLKLIVITHGDFDHTGNAAHLREKYRAKIAMHYGDSGMVERGDMFWNRKKGNVLIRVASSMLFRFGKSDRFIPDLYVEDGYDFSEYGLNARVFHIPGHSKGSLGVLTGDGDLFCGDLLVNGDKPSLNSIIDNPAEADASIEKLKRSAINTVYPGHGNPFQMTEFTESGG